MEELKLLIREQPEELDNSLPKYVTAILPSDVALQELHTYPMGKLGAWIQEVVKVESPIHFEEMARRIADANGISKIGSRIRASITNATDYAVKEGFIIKKNDFLWNPENHSLIIRERSLLPANSRKLAFISPEEMNLAIAKVVENSIAIQPESAVILIAKLFGYSRVTEDMKMYIIQSIDKATNDRIVIKDGEFLKAATT